jgi:hypothetical protein
MYTLVGVKFDNADHNEIARNEVVLELMHVRIFGPTRETVTKERGICITGSFFIHYHQTLGH